MKIFKKLRSTCRSFFIQICPLNFDCFCRFYLKMDVNTFPCLSAAHAFQNLTYDCSSALNEEILEKTRLISKMKILQ